MRRFQMQPSNGTLGRCTPVSISTGIPPTKSRWMLRGWSLGNACCMSGSSSTCTEKDLHKHKLYELWRGLRNTSAEKERVGLRSRESQDAQRMLSPIMQDSLVGFSDSSAWIPAACEHQHLQSSFIQLHRQEGLQRDRRTDGMRFRNRPHVLDLWAVFSCVHLLLSEWLQERFLIRKISVNHYHNSPLLVTSDVNLHKFP